MRGQGGVLSHGRKKEKSFWENGSNGEGSERLRKGTWEFKDENALPNCGSKVVPKERKLDAKGNQRKRSGSNVPQSIRQRSSVCKKRLLNDKWYQSGRSVSGEGYNDDWAAPEN